MAKHLRVTEGGVLTCKTVLPNGSRMMTACYPFFLTDRDPEGFETRCLYCDNYYRQGYYMETHLKLVHLKQQPLSGNHLCTDCGEMVKIKHYTMEDHKRLKHGAEKIHCAQCPKTFSTNRNYLCHLKVHTLGKEYKCNICSKTLSNSYNLKVHMRIHSKDFVYQCELCGVNFAQKNSLNVHMKKHKKEGNEKTSLGTKTQNSHSSLGGRKQKRNPQTYIKNKMLKRLDSGSDNDSTNDNLDLDLLENREPREKCHRKGGKNKFVNDYVFDCSSQLSQPRGKKRNKGGNQGDDMSDFDWMPDNMHKTKAKKKTDKNNSSEGIVPLPTLDDIIPTLTMSSMRKIDQTKKWLDSQRYEDAENEEKE